MLQNRVDPFGNIIKTEARGLWMGNRGILHNHNKELQRLFKLKVWITCKLEFKGRKREVMAPNKYTELFFMDEANSFAAGHRPCFECRKDDYKKFKTLWLKGNPEYGFNEKTSIIEIDKILHRERINRDGSKIIFEASVANLPDGTFVQYEQNAFLVFNGFMYLWSPSGYGKDGVAPHTNLLQVLTPRSIVNTFKAGYSPQIALNY
jgi:hypothetical protein